MGEDSCEVSHKLVVSQIKLSSTTIRDHDGETLSSPISNAGSDPSCAAVGDTGEMRTLWSRTASDGGSSLADLSMPSYFVREVQELTKLPLPQGNACLRFHKRHVFSTKSVYDGQWLGIHRHGFGVQTWPDGTTYMGEWREDRASGKGRFQYCDGHI